MKKPKVLNLSDIHFKDDTIGEGEFSDRNEFYFESVLRVILDIDPTHIIINGDMAFSARYSQYETCYNILLKEFLDNKPSARFIMVPGNHSCNRNIPHVLLDKINLSKSFTLETHSDKRDFEKEVNKQLNDKDKKADVLSALSDLIDTDYRSLLSGKSNVELFELLFTDYTKFTKKYVIERLANINENYDNPIEFESYKDSDGLHGTIYDKEYNIIFACLNSVWYSWGKETFDELFKDQKSKISFHEYGNLGLRDSDHVVERELKELGKRNILNHTLVCLYSHVPLSWLSYDSQFINNSDLSYIFRVTDIACFSHIHVEHFAPSLYREKTYFYESPQLSDHRFNIIKDSEIKSELTDTLGFSYFDFFVDNLKFYHNTYKISSHKNFTLTGGSKYNFEWVQKNSQQQLLKQKIQPITCYDCIDPANVEGVVENVFLSKSCGFWKYILGIAKSVSTNIDGGVPVKNNVFLDLPELFNSQYSPDITIRSDDSRFIPIKVNSSLIVFMNIEVNDDPNILYEAMSRFICHSNIMDFGELKSIKFYFFDWSLYSIFMGNYTNNNFVGKELFVYLTNNLENWMIKFKANLFSKLKDQKVSEECKSQLIKLADVDIGYKIISFVEYKDYIVKIT
jgi:hypothetical protein